MTVNSATATASYTGNGSTTAFPVPFYFLVDTDLKVSRKPAGAPTSSVLTLNSDYTIAGAGNQLGGTLMMLTAPAANDQLFIERNVQAVQQTAYPENNRFPAASHEKALDRLTMLAQQLISKLSFGLFRDPLGATYDLGNGRLINSGTAVNGNDVPNLQQVQTAIVGGAAPILTGPTGSSTVGFIQSGDGAVARTAQDKLREVISAADFGVDATGTTNSTAALTSALNAAAGKVLELPPGTIVVDQVTIPANTTVRGHSGMLSTIRRSATTSLNSLLAVTASGVTLDSFAVDGNRASNPNAANNILVTGCGQFTLRNVVSRNAKGISGGYGCGVAVVNTTDAANFTYSAISGGEYSDNDGYGAYFNVASYFRVSNGRFVRNALDGISIVDRTNPATPTARYWSVNDCTLAFNQGSGIGVDGFGNEALNPSSQYNTISDCDIHHNAKYGLVYQSSSCAISGNVIANNGDSDTNGGVLLNAQYTSFTGNTVVDNAQYGVDAGGCSNVVISGNLVRDNVGPSGGGAGINIGASTFTNVTGNTLIGNGGAGGGGNIFLHGIDGGTIPAFRTLGGQCNISENLIQLANNNQFGIQVDKGDVRGVHVTGNTVYGGLASRAYSYQARFVEAKSNAHYADNTSPYVILPVASSLVIPDDGTEVIDVSGTGSINEILTQSMSDYKGKVRAVFMTAFGSGYTTAPTVTFSGGGGTGAAGVAYVYQGQVRAIHVTNPGSGYTSAPSITLSGSPGAGAAWNVYTECPNNFGRVIRIHGQAAGVVVNSVNNIRLGAAGPWTSTGSNFLTLIGMYNGNWYEHSRS